MAKKQADSSKKLPEESAEVWINREVYGKTPEKYHFVLKDGKQLKNLKELTNSLATMTDDVFRHHVNNAKNDFSNWVKDVFNERELAEEIKKFGSRIETELALYRHFNKRLEKLVSKLAKK